MCLFFFKQKTAYEMRISDWSSDVCSSDLAPAPVGAIADRRHAAIDAAVLPFDALADGHRHGALLRPGVALLLAFVQAVDELQGEDGIERPVVAAALPVAVMVAIDRKSTRLNSSH